ncbi:hypothetical protein GCM10023319_34510 [Nocardia iowensis]
MQRVRDSVCSWFGAYDVGGQRRHLDPAPAVLTAMLDGWRRQQAARFLREKTIVPRYRLSTCPDHEGTIASRLFALRAAIRSRRSSNLGCVAGIRQKCIESLAGLFATGGEVVALEHFP